MKKKILKLMSAVLAMTFLVTSFAGCKKNNTEANEIIWYIVGMEAEDTGWIIDEVKKEIKTKTGVSVDFRMLTSDNYDLTLSSGEEFDIIFAPDYLNYWENSEKGAFAEISDEDLKEYAPYIWENGGDSLDAPKYKGVRYAIAQMTESALDRCIVARGDLMEKYGIESISNTEEIEEYLTKVAENEPDMIPFDVKGNNGYSLLSMFAVDWGWFPVGKNSYAEHVYYNINDPERKIFIAAEQPEMLEFTKTMKRWYDKGFFSKSALSNKISSLDSFKSGRSALGLVGNPAECQSTYEELMKDDRASWKPYFFTRFQTKQSMNVPTGHMAAISAFSNKKETALKVLNEMFQNEKIYRLVHIGVEGKHYEINENGKLVILDADSKGWMNIGVGNSAFALEKELTFPGNEELTKKLKDMRMINYGTRVRVSLEGIREIDLALSEVYDQYTQPRYYGMIKSTPEKALAEEVKALKTAGIDTYIESLQNQFDEYMNTLGK